MPEFPPGFGWDPDKDAINRRKHNISFEYAIAAFSDPYGFVHGTTFKDGEVRFSYVGAIYDRVLSVVYHDREGEVGDPLIWIISARKADKGEVDAYFKR